MVTLGGRLPAHVEQRVTLWGGVPATDTDNAIVTTPNWLPHRYLPQRGPVPQFVAPLRLTILGLCPQGSHPTAWPLCHGRHSARFTRAALA
jgi:hypothetical protein